MSSGGTKTMIMRLKQDIWLTQCMMLQQTQSKTLKEG